VPTGGGQTTVIQRILERRAERPPANTEETTASIAVMLRVVPPPKALLVILDPVLRQLLERRITADILDFIFVADEDDALRRFIAEFRPVVVTDSLEMVRRLRARTGERSPYIVYVSDLDQSSEREAGLVAGADDCVGRRAAEREIDARLASARRIAELETVLRITLAENRKLSATDDLTRVASRRFFSKHFPR
jgi:PleD family two-component response regulator